MSALSPVLRQKDSTRRDPIQSRLFCEKREKNGTRSLSPARTEQDGTTRLIPSRSLTGPGPERSPRKTIDSPQACPQACRPYPIFLLYVPRLPPIFRTLHTLDRRRTWIKCNVWQVNVYRYKPGFGICARRYPRPDPRSMGYDILGIFSFWFDGYSRTTERFVLPLGQWRATPGRCLRRRGTKDN